MCVDACALSHYCTFLVPAPTLTISLNGEIGTTGTAVQWTEVTLQGLATLDDVVDTEVTVLVEWAAVFPDEGYRLERLYPPGSASVPAFITSSTPHAFTLVSVVGVASAVYLLSASVFPSNPTYILQSNRYTTDYALTLQPYPNLVINRRVRGGECGVNETAILTGSVNLLPNTATNHVITYSWTRPDGRPIRQPSKDLTVNEGTLVVRSITGSFNLTACLTILGADVMDHCSTAQFFISTDG